MCQIKQLCVMVVKVSSLRLQTLVKSTKSLCVSVTADRGLLDLETLPLSSPPPAGVGAACLLYLTSQPESWGPVQLRGRGNAEKRSEEKERSNYVQSLSSEDPPQVHYRGPALATKRRPFGAKGAGMFRRNMTPPDPCAGKRNKIKKPTPLAFGSCSRGVV